MCKTDGVHQKNIYDSNSGTNFFENFLRDITMNLLYQYFFFCRKTKCQNSNFSALAQTDEQLDGASTSRVGDLTCN